MPRFFSTCLLILLLAFAANIDAAKAARPRAETLPGPLQASVISVLDGDTLSVRVHVWIGQELVTDVRIRGIDTPELRSGCAAERKMAQIARDKVMEMLADGRVVLTDIRLEKYAGRVLATVSNSGGADIGAQLLAQGLARAYGGDKRQGWCDARGKLAAH